VKIGKLERSISTWGLNNGGPQFTERKLLYHTTNQNGVGVAGFVSSDWINFGQNVVSERLIDPTSPLFRDVYTVYPEGTTSTGDPQYVVGFSTESTSHYICGEVNAKNRLGAYVGYSGFAGLLYVVSETNELAGAVLFDDSFLYDTVNDPCINAVELTL
jgi:hypothetical protein